MLEGTASKRYLHKVLNAAVNADGSGNASIDIWPGLREAHPNNEAIISTNPKGTFRLEGPFEHPVDHRRLYQISFSAVEAL